MDDSETLKNKQTENLVPDESRTDKPSNKINKRRSSIFQRRSINPHLQDVSQFIEEKSQSKEYSEVEDKFDLNAYISSLRNERAEWKKILNERKSQRRRLTKQELNMGDECELDLSVLSDSERFFISSRPNYHQISKNIKYLVPVAVKIATLNTHINHLNESLIESIEEKISESRKEIIELVNK